MDESTIITNDQPVKQRSSRKGALDLLRIFSALIIVLYHSIYNFGCNYGILTPFIQMGSIFMTCFFILSGYCIYLTSSKMDVNKPSNVVYFYLKRVLSLFPLYCVMIIINTIAFTGDRVTDTLVAFPIELLCLQAFFPAYRDVALNGGYWFVSCVFICYLLFPLLLTLINKISIKTKLIILLIVSALIMYFPVVEYQFNIVSLYDSPLFRFLEFSIGALLCSIRMNIKSQKWWFNLITSFLAFSLLITLIYVFYNSGITLEQRMYYEVITIPLFSIIIFTLSDIKCKKLDESIIVKYLASICYAVYLIQLPLQWYRALVEAVSIQNNILLILFVIFIYYSVAIIMHELIERPSGFIRNKILNKFREHYL